MADYDEPTTEALGAIPDLALSNEQRTCLLVVKGPEKGAVFPLGADPVVLGRSPAQADIVLAGRGLSRSHVRVQQLEDGSIEVADLGSTNGIFINGRKTDKGVLGCGDTLALGPEVVLRLEAPDKTIESLIQDMYRGATRDPLTGILNRRSFLQRLHEECAAASRHGIETCLAMLDVDHFKSINDTHGHPAGDAVLVQLAHLLSKAVRAEDVLGRYGGEEFIVLVRHSPLEGAVNLMERIRQEVEATPFPAPTPAGELQLKVTVSVGVSSLTPSFSAASVIEAADQALYKAKRSGRNRVCQAQPCP